MDQTDMWQVVPRHVFTVDPERSRDRSEQTEWILAGAEIGQNSVDPQGNRYRSDQTEWIPKGAEIGQSKQSGSPREQI